MLYYAKGSANSSLTDVDISEALTALFAARGDLRNVLIVPPDYSRFHSRAGQITSRAVQMLGRSVRGVLPALGTHFPMSTEEKTEMFAGVDPALFIDHNWRKDVVSLGEVPASFVEKVSENKLSFTWPAQLHSSIAAGTHDLILSIGQVVPHEVIGMANYNKNIFVGTGGSEGISKSHYLGAVYGMERIMGRADTPVRAVLNYASEHFAAHLPIVYIQTVVAADEQGKLHLRGLYIGDDSECFYRAAKLSLAVNFTMLEEAPQKIVVRLDEKEFKSTWLGNKSIYRTRMALADDAELIVLAPGVSTFGEDPQIDALIRKYGYQGTTKTLQAVEQDEALSGNLSAAAHLIHGSSEGRFTITYCTEHLSQTEVEHAGYNWMPLKDALQKYGNLKEGYNDHPLGPLYYISQPALGLWAHKSRFNQ